ncbi:uncharacterized protein LOC117170005 [Belonocnema kinseyi]|uniref:uncharacterized protein LOC117170005 n=1 Tax=Belonocnema kinseyi TaxID=2817044 RepID=UPI00143CF33C|nr:uncharacterized protein LOC117170005 [Belonocnema kinseyi]
MCCCASGFLLEHSTGRRQYIAVQWPNLPISEGSGHRTCHPVCPNDDDEQDKLPDELAYSEAGGITRYTDDQVLALIEDARTKSSPRPANQNEEKDLNALAARLQENLYNNDYGGRHPAYSMVAGQQRNTGRASQSPSQYGMPDLSTLHIQQPATTSSLRQHSTGNPYDYNAMMLGQQHNDGYPYSSNTVMIPDPQSTSGPSNKNVRTYKSQRPKASSLPPLLPTPSVPPITNVKGTKQRGTTGPPDNNPSTSRTQSNNPAQQKVRTILGTLMSLVAIKHKNNPEIRQLEDGWTTVQNIKGQFLGTWFLPKEMSKLKLIPEDALWMRIKILTQRFTKPKAFDVLVRQGIPVGEYRKNDFYAYRY